MGKPMAPERVGDRIRQARFQRQAQLGRALTQTALAASIGVSPGAVSQWENGTTEPSLSVLPKLARALGVTAGWLAFGETAAPARAELPDLEPQISGTLTDEQKEASRARRAARKKKGNSHGRAG